MYKILITSGPTREYLDPVRFLTNASSGRMGAALAAAAIEFGCEVTIVTGPVKISYPEQARVIEVETTQQMLDACIKEFPLCDCVIGAAAPCDYKPVHYSSSKLSKTGETLKLEFQPTADILAALGTIKTTDQTIIGFALETDNGVTNAQEKLRRKNCDLICLNAPSAINSLENKISLISDTGVVAQLSGSKKELATKIIRYALELDKIK
ncbi:MAG: phosphopantothenoylcysteine decarboxylase [Thermoguttaceae bacterium]|nr:phosphopantothenoylcysteine decarboxylase [Thermoguttaceae bacterium]